MTDIGGAGFSSSGGNASLRAPLVLPAEVGKPLTTEGGNTLDDGTGTMKVVSLVAGNLMGGTMALSPPGAPTVTPEGTAGATTYDYTVTATNVYGSTPASAVGSTTTGNATLSTTDYNLVSWPAVPLPAGSPGNLVYDSNLTNAIASVGPTWTPYGVTIGTAAGDWNVANAGTDSAEFLLYGTGAASTNQAFMSQVIDVTPGVTYIFSVNLDIASATGGSAYLDGAAPGADPLTVVPVYFQKSLPAGTSGVESVPWTAPAGVTQICVGVQIYGLVVPTGSTVSFSEIQLTQTDTVEPYEAGPLPTYDIYGRSGTLGLIGSTTALAFEDTGAAAPGAAAPKSNTTGSFNGLGVDGTLQAQNVNTQRLVTNPPTVTTPAVPASGTAVTNDTNSDVMVYVTGGTLSGATEINGVSTGQENGSFYLPSGFTITLTYTAPPTWVWLAV